MPHEFLDKFLLEKLSVAEAGKMASLHVLIAGPAVSGKTTQALAYAAALAAKGVVNRNIGVADYAHVDSAQRLWIKEFDAAIGGVLIIRNPHVLRGGSAEAVETHIYTAMYENQSAVVLVLPADAVDDYLRFSRSIAARIGIPLKLDKTFTGEEQASFRQQQRHLLRSDWWKNRELCLKTEKPISSPKTARFRAKPERSGKN